MVYNPFNDYILKGMSIMISNNVNQEIDNNEHRERAIKEMLAEIEEQIKSANQKLVQLENNFHRQRILNQLSVRNFDIITMKDFGYVGKEKFDLNDFLKEIENQSTLISDLESLKNILNKEYLGN